MRCSSIRLLLVLCAVAVLGFSGSAQAGLIGTNVTIDFTGVDFNETATVLVTSGVEVQCTDPNDSDTCEPDNLFPPGGMLFSTDYIDFGDMSIAFELGAGFPSTQTLSFLNLDFGGPVLTGVVLNTQIPWLTVVGFTSNSLTLDLTDPLGDPSVGGTGMISLVTSPVQAAPEPGTLLLLGGGLLALGLRRSRRRRQA